MRAHQSGSVVAIGVIALSGSGSAQSQGCAEGANMWHSEATPGRATRVHACAGAGTIAEIYWASAQAAPNAERPCYYADWAQGRPGVGSNTHAPADRGHRAVERANLLNCTCAAHFKAAESSSQMRARGHATARCTLG